MSINVRHFQVSDYKVIICVLRQLQRVATVTGKFAVKAQWAECARGCVPDLRLVVDD
jgi:hypothetical protein